MTSAPAHPAGNPAGLGAWGRELGWISENPILDCAILEDSIPEDRTPGRGVPMPTYEYECTKGHTFEVVQRITEDPLTRCQVCRAKCKRLISAPRFILKGGGWYSDGYSSGSSSGSSSSSKSSGGSESSSKSDSKDSKGSTGSDSAASSSSNASSSASS